MKSLNNFPVKDMIGNTYGRLTVLGEACVEKGHALVFAGCSCDKSILIRASSLLVGNTRSCGCYNIEVAKKEIARRSTTHGDSKTRLYHIWCGIKRRCYRESETSYHRYGGRGITLCEEWKDYSSFKRWAEANGYSDELSIDRINNNGNYDPSNCRWATCQEQARNKESVKKVIINDITYYLSDLAKETGINIKTLWYRLDSGVPIENLLDSSLIRKDAAYAIINGEKVLVTDIAKQAGVSDSAIRVRIKNGITGVDLFKPNQFKYSSITINGETHTLSEWSRISGIPRSTLQGRISKGLPDALILENGRICKQNLN